MAYQVIKMYGDFEPWWFIENWKDDIVAVREFQNYDDALLYYQEEWQDLREQFPKINSKPNLMSAFWRTDDMRWCEECDEDLQQYHSLMMLSNWQELPETLNSLDYNQTNAQGIHPACSLNKHNSLS
ncbi:dipicolinate synthase [Streptococcus agalactiae LMG 14747]|uniref:Dipicolinate synthase n=2 Tax=Streptococcus TaxID=1301 RepID=V6Z4K5_STRAG|nr:DUF1033 family protein [Streptococcus acidominimus]ESV55216.1 dipicolinate synthase [Streptococcus agalactiae LMG 14747]SNV46836.1 DNA binding protein, FIG046916 [Streptococcus acidominimus]